MTSNLKPKIIIFLGSVRPGRMSDRVGKLVRSVVEANGMESTIFDPSEMPFELLKTPLHFMKNPEADAPTWMKEANEKIKQADGFIMVSSEYNCGVPPALANMLDHFAPSSYRHRPCGIVTYSMGSYGGVRASVVLRPMASELGMITVPCDVAIGTVHQVLDDEGNCKLEKVIKNLTKLAKEVSWYAKAIQSFTKTEALPS